MDRQLLLDNADWVRRLAHALVSDPERAEELHQDLWVVALERPPERGLRSWMRTVARNLVRQRHRHEAQRRDVERDGARPEGLPSTDELVERVAEERRVVACVLELDDVHRRVILLRFFEGWTPSEIAKRTDTPLATVKTRLRRALARLREELDEAHGGDGRRWLAALAPLARPEGKEGVALASAAGGGIAAKVLVGALVILCVVAGARWLEHEPVERVEAVTAALRTVPEPDEPALDPPSPEEVRRVEAGSELAGDAESGPHGALRIRTVDAGGRPLGGVPVAVRVRDARPELGGGYDHTGWNGVTGPDGLLRLEDPEHEVVGLDPRSSRLTLAALDVPMREPIEVPFDVKEPPAEPITLRVPETGRVVVHLVDPSGEPSREWALVSLRPVFEDVTVGGLSRIGPYVRRWMQGPDVVFTHVEPGLRLRASWQTDDEDSPSATFDGPGASGEEVELTLTRTPDRHLVRARVLDENGQPIQDIVHLLAGDDPRGFTARSHSEEDGSVLLTLFSADVQLSLSMVQVFTEPFGRGRLAVDIGDVQTTRGTTLDLGDLVLEPLPLLVQGRLVSDDGAPLHGAVVRTRVRRSPEDEAPRWPVNELQVQADRDGHFEIRGAFPDSEPFLLAEHSPYLASGPIPYPPGTEPIEIVLSRGGSVAGSLLLADGVPPTWLRVSVDDAVFSVREDGTFLVPEVAPGLHDVAIRSWRHPEPLVQVEDVEVVPGEESSDPRLESIDLRDRLRRVTLWLDAAGGGAPPPAHVCVAGDGDDTMHVQLLEGEGTLLIGAGPVDLEVLTPGYRPLELVAVDRSLRMTLEPGPAVEVSRPPELVLPGGVELGVVLVPLGREAAHPRHRIHAEAGDGRLGWGLWETMHAPRFEDGDTLSTTLGAPGLHEVEWVLFAPWTAPARVPGGTVDVPATGGRLTPSFDARVLAGALAHLERMRAREGT